MTNITSQACQRLWTRYGARLLVVMGWVTAQLPSAYSGEAEKFHGMEFSAWNLPSGYSQVAGGCIETELGGDICDFGIVKGDLTTTSPKKIRVVFLQRNTGTSEEVYVPSKRRTESVPIYRIEDSLSLEGIPDGAFELNDCALRAHPQYKVVALFIVPTYKSSGKRKVRPPIRMEKAWRVDAAKRKFVEVQPNDVVCGLHDTSGI